MDETLLAEARRAQERLIDAERDADVARAEFHRAVRRLHLHGASLRELASGLGLSHQRVHQIVEAAGGSRRWLRRDPARPDPGLLVCTFCGKNQKQVKKLIAGPSVYICDGWVGLAQAYGLTLDRPPLQLDPNYLYKALTARKVDAVVGLSTDWQLSMEAPKLRVLADDRRYFPSYFAAALLREEVLTRHPELTPLLAKLAGRISNAAMRAMIREVVVDKRRPSEVARAFLEREKL